MTTVRPDKKVLPPGPAEDIQLDFSDEMVHVMCRLFKQYGDIYKAYCPVTSNDVYVLNHPDYAAHVLVNNQRNYVKGIGIDRVKILLGNGLMVSEGDFWKKQRRMVQPAFHRNVILQLLELIKQANLDVLEKWLQRAQKCEQINITQEMSDLTLTIVLRSIFSEDLDTIIEKAGVNPFAMLTAEPARNLSFAVKFRSLAKLVIDCVEARRAENRRPVDFLSMLMDARDKNTDEAMPDKQLIDEIMTLIVAGHETTASALNWAWYLLSQHPHVAEKMRQELDYVLAGRVATNEDLSRLVYTKQIIDETLRLYPPGWLLTRRAIAEDEIGGYAIAPGTDILICLYTIHRHPEFWDEPDTFIPERFANDGAARQHRYAYLPFSAGPRICIGEMFAMIEMQMHIATMAQNVKLNYVVDQPVELEAQVNLRTKHPLFMFPQQR